MATTDFQWGRIPVPGADRSVKNTDGTNDIAAGNVVTIDASNPMSGTQGVPGVTRGTTDDYAFGVAVEAIPKGAIGRVQCLGVIQVVASAGITAGAVVQADASGQVKTQVATKAQLGQALTGASGSGDLVWVALSIARNA